MFLQLLFKAPRQLKFIRRAKNIILSLQQKDLLEVVGTEIRIAANKLDAIENIFASSKYSFTDDELTETFVTANKVEAHSKKNEKSNQFLALYKRGLTYEAIGVLHGITRERVRQILTVNPDFHQYLREYEESKLLTERENEEFAKQELRRKSIGYLYPEKVAELWDCEKNGDLKPDDVIAKGTLHLIWWKCHRDGHSWQKKANDITNSWDRYKSSGCPLCAGRTRKPEKQTTLAEEYLEYVIEYWNFEKNAALNLNPEKLTLGSNYRAWFKCPKDGNEWQAGISSTVVQQWSRGNTGCRVCNGTHLRKNGVWGKASKLIEKFPDEVAKYWDFEKNNAINFYPSEVTTGSQKKAWFRCPIDGSEWQASVSIITANSWRKGNNGCLYCGKGWTADSIQHFVASIEKHIPNLTQSERYKIFEQAGILRVQNVESLKIVREVIKGKLTGQKLREVLQGKQTEKTESLVETVNGIDANSDLEIAEADLTVKNIQSSQIDSDFTEQVEETNELPSVKTHKSLEFLSSSIVASSDQEAIDFFVASRRNRIWAEVFEDESAVEGIESFANEGYGRKVRDEFLDEYNQAREMQIPNGWAFRVNGKITPPNLMQKVTAVRLKNQK